MSREIKFRGKRVDNDEWAYGYLVGSADSFSTKRFVTKGPVYQAYEVISETVGQFTGLKDINDVEIFEGDIVTSKDYPFQDDGERNYDGVIEWYEDNYQFGLTLRLVNGLKRGISDGMGESLDGFDGVPLEVIGNIYEDGQLLEDEP